MHVRHILYKHYKTRYPNFQATKEDADAAIDELKKQGYKRATKKGVLQMVKVRRLNEIAAKKEAQSREPAAFYFQKHPNLLLPFPFYEAHNFCFEWKDVSGKVMAVSYYVWTTGMAYRGGQMIPYEETFQEYSLKLEKLQSEPRRQGESYETDWYFRLQLEKAEWDESLNAYLIPVITCDASGGLNYYFDEVPPEEKPEVEEVPPEEKPEEVPPEAEPEEPPPPEAKPLPGLTPEQQIQLEREKAKVEAEAKYAAELKKEKLNVLKSLLKEGIITKSEFFEEFGKI